MVAMDKPRVAPTTETAATGNPTPLSDRSGTLASGPKVRLAGSKVKPLPSRRLPEVLKAINPGLADDVQGL